MLEQWFVAGTALLSATLATMALHTMLEAPASVLGWCLLSSLLWIALYTAGSYLVGRKDPISLAKDR